MKADEIRAMACVLAPLLAAELTTVAYSVDGAAARLNCGRDLVYAEINAGRLASWHVGTRRFIRREELERWALERENEARGAA